MNFWDYWDRWISPYAWRAMAIGVPTAFAVLMVCGDNNDRPDNYGGNPGTEVVSRVYVQWNG